MISQLQYVGIPKRCLALFIDGLIQTVVGFVVFFGISKIELETSTKLFSYALFAALVQWGYYSLMESSKARGTFGKMALGISVCDATGREISLRQATLRFLGKSLWLVLFFIGAAIGAFVLVSGDGHSPLLFIVLAWWIVSFLLGTVGYLMPAFMPERQALHDRIAHTFVVEDDSPDRHVPQKVIFQMVAIAIVARLLFHVIPSVPIPSNIRNNNNSQANQETPVRNQDNNNPNRDTSRPANNPTDTNQETLTISRCGLTEQLSSPSSNSYIDGEWKVNFAVGIEAHESTLRMKGETGMMRTQFFDKDAGKTRTVLQQMNLKVSPTGIWLLGTNPVNEETNQPDANYSPDNIYIQRAPSGEFTAVNCDNNNNRSSVSIAPVNN
ncbi:RDD family protein [Pseudanabaenaceae cyanobacterium LEGE 13415]|nr:RDD family protein [Pseudanabaenaceae cyanobacterium LEGE 13415]